MSSDQVAVETLVARVEGNAAQLTIDQVVGAGPSTLEVKFVRVDGQDLVQVTIPHMLGFKSSVFEAPASMWPFVLKAEGS